MWFLLNFLVHFVLEKSVLQRGDQKRKFIVYAAEEKGRPETPDPRFSGGLVKNGMRGYLVRIPLPTLGSFSILRVITYCWATEMMLFTTQ